VKKSRSGSRLVENVSFAGVYAAEQDEESNRDLEPKKDRLSYPTGVKGGCSSQNNRKAILILRIFRREVSKFRKKISKQNKKVRVSPIDFSRLMANFLFRLSLSGSIRRRDIGSRSSADKTTAANDAGHLRLKIVRRDWSHYDGWDAVGAPQRHR